MGRTIIERLQYWVTTEGCWEWSGAITAGGYGAMWANGRAQVAHRVSYEAHRGPVPEGLELDHLCHTEAVARDECPGGPDCLHRRCINPDHLEPVTHHENALRGQAMKNGENQRCKTHCAQGHEFTEENIYRPPKRPNERMCKTCITDRNQARSESNGQRAD